MIKAASLFCFTVLLAATPVAVRAQSAEDVNRAADEAVRRQADTILLRQKLALAQEDQQRGDLQAALKHYEDCFKLVQGIGTSCPPDLAQQTRGGLVVVLFAAAKLDQDQKDYPDADARFGRILVVDPGNQEAILRKKQNQVLLDAQAGTVPSLETTSQIPAWHSNDVRVATMVQDGKLLFEAGKLDDAEAKLMLATKEEPGNAAANSYLEMIAEKRAADALRRAELQGRQGLMQVEKAWDVPLRGEQRQNPNIFSRTNLVYTTKGRQNILSKLEQIHLDVKYNGLTLEEVVNNLKELAAARDPDKTGVNFLINRQTASPGAGAPGAIDPTTGLPVAPLPTEAVDIATAITIKISPGLTDVRLEDALDAVTKSADKPANIAGNLSYSVDDYAVVFSIKSTEPVQMYTRTFHVDPNTFRQGLEGVGAVPFADSTVQLQNGGGSSSGSAGGAGGAGGSGGTIVPRVNVAGGTAGGIGGGGGGGGAGGQNNGLRLITRSNDVSEVNVAVRNFFIAAGVDLNPANPLNLGKSIFFNDRKGTLMVHSTGADLDIIAQAVEALNQSPPEINIKAKFVELTQNDNRALGFDWYLGNVMLGGGRVAASGGTQPSFAGPSTAANPGDGITSFFPGVVTGGTALVPGANTTIPPGLTDGLLTGGLRNSLNAPAVASITGVLTDPQFKMVVHALEKRDGVDLMTAPEVTTESGRQAQMQAVDVQAIVIGNNFNNQQNNSFGGVQNGVNTPIVSQPIQIQPQTQLLPFGPVLDVIPYVSADEFSIQMTIIPTVTEFIGYDDPGPFALVAQSAAANSTPVTAVLPLPHFRLRQVVTSAIVWDAQTIVIGGLITDSVTKVKDKIPLLGDMPLVGRLFRSESVSKTKKNLLIFVTPTIINPDGSRYHSDDEMPFAQNSIPTQRPITQ
jgi:type II secretory pathway component GspD/PulD (secretin)/tetratricopeptide (TPR) repeat protein